MIDFENPTNEQVERAMACETAQDVLDFAAAEGYELSDEELDAVSGGLETVVVKAPNTVVPFLRFIFEKKNQGNSETA